MKYIDIHCHPNFEDFDADREEIIKRAQEQGIGMIVVGTDIASSKKAVEMAQTHENMWAVVGLHPTEVQNEPFSIADYRALAEHKKVVGIGECGFDYLAKGDRPGYALKDLQQEVFEKHIALANEVKKPLMLHLRNGIDPAHNAYKDTLEVLKKHARVHGDVHFFAGNWEEGKAFLDLGFRLSFTGVITFARGYDEVIRKAPLNMIMSETDAPYVAPVPYRGQRNEPAYVTEVAHAIADIRGESREVVLQHLVDNARKLFSI